MQFRSPLRWVALDPDQRVTGRATCDADEVWAAIYVARYGTADRNLEFQRLAHYSAFSTLRRLFHLTVPNVPSSHVIRASPSCRNSSATPVLPSGSWTTLSPERISNAPERLPGNANGCILFLRLFTSWAYAIADPCRLKAATAAEACAWAYLHFASRALDAGEILLAVFF